MFQNRLHGAKLILTKLTVCNPVCYFRVRIQPLVQILRKNISTPQLHVLFQMHHSLEVPRGLLSKQNVT
jgi:hypothetical protein